MRTLIRFILMLILIVGVAALYFGYRAGSSIVRPQLSGDPSAPLRPEVGTSGVDTTRAREIGAEAGARVAEAGARATAELEEAALSARIKAKMALDDQVKARDISVSTTGSTVRLRGVVHSQAERERAVRLAAETAGITHVNDELRVQP